MHATRVVRLIGFQAKHWPIFPVRVPKMSTTRRIFGFEQMNFCCMKWQRIPGASYTRFIRNTRISKFYHSHKVNILIRIFPLVFVCCVNSAEMKMWSTPTNKRTFLYSKCNNLRCIGNNERAVDCVAQLLCSLGRVKGEPTPNTR